MRFCSNSEAKGEATHVTGIQHGSIFPPHFGEHVTLVAEQPVHVPDEAQIIFVPARIANRHAPLLNQLKDPVLDAGRPDWRALRESPHQLVEELLCADLQVEGVAAIFDADVEQAEGEQGNIGVAVVDEADNGRGSLARGAALFAVDEVRNLEVERQIGLVVFGAAGSLDEAQELRRGATSVAPAIASRGASRSSFHLVLSCAALVWWELGQATGELSCGVDLGPKPQGAVYCVSVVSIAVGSTDCSSDWDRSSRSRGGAKAGFSGQKQGQGRRRGRSWSGIRIRAMASYLVSGAWSQLLQRRSGNAGLDETCSSIRLCAGDVVTEWRRRDERQQRNERWRLLQRIEWLCCYRCLLVAALYVCSYPGFGPQRSAVSAGSLGSNGAV